jgi:hypothetical protein
MTVDWQQVGSAVVALVVGAGGWIIGRKDKKATSEANVAKARAEGATAAAETSVVELMREEVRRLSVRVAALESREGRLIRHIYRLEGLMRGNGMEPPHFDIDGDAPQAPQ